MWEGFRQDPWGSLLTRLSDAATFGYGQYQNGKWTEGSILHGYKEIAGEIGGSNRVREAGYKTADALRTAEASAARDKANMELQNYRADLASSQAAQGAQNTSAARDNAALNGYVGGQQLGSSQKDFLGL
jgi:hypothetical protein